MSNPPFPLGAGEVPPGMPKPTGGQPPLPGGEGQVPPGMPEPTGGGAPLVPLTDGPTEPV